MKSLIYKVDYVGHPLLDAIDKRDVSVQNNQKLRSEMDLGDQPIILLLPGSRKQEINAVPPNNARASKSL